MATTKAAGAVGMTVRDAYEAGRYVTRHLGTEGARDRQALFSGDPWVAFDALDAAYWLGRDRLARTGEH